MRLVGGRIGLIAGAIMLILASPLFAPQLLAFPYKAEAGDSTIWSETPIDQAALEKVIARAEARVATSPIARDGEPRRIFLTDGGWRWAWLANSTGGALALTRPFTDPVIIVHSSDLASDRVTNSSGTQRSLSSVIAHETTHGILRRHFGRIATLHKPQWLIEGYCDHVAGESTLSADQADALEREGIESPALVYLRGRQRVAAILAVNGGDVDNLFAGVD